MYRRVPLRKPVVAIFEARKQRVIWNRMSFVAWFRLYAEDCIEEKSESKYLNIHMKTMVQMNMNTSNKDLRLDAQTAEHVIYLRLKTNLIQ